MGTFINDGAGADTGSINASDNLTGGEGSDSASIRAGDEMTAVLMPVLTSIETVTINNVAAGLAAHTGFSDFAPAATSLITSRTSNAIEINDIDFTATTVTLSATNQNITLEGTGAATINVAGVTAGDLQVDTATAATLNVTSDSTIDDIANGALTSLTVTGSGALTLSAVTEGLTSLDASDNTGGISVTGLDIEATSFTGTAADDTIVAGAADALDNAGDDTSLDGGDGTDTLVITADIVDASETTNIENVMLAASGMTYAMDIDGATGIWAGTPGADNAGVNNDTAAISGYDGSAAIYVVDANQLDATEGDTINLDVGVDTDYTAETTVNIVTSKTATQDFVVADIDIDDEAGGDDIESFIINVSGTRGVTIANIDLDAHGDTPTLAINSSVDVTVSDVDFATTTTDDDLGNTITFAGSTGAVTYVMGDSGYDADADDSITGGSGSTDVISIDIADDALAPTISGFETIQITDANAGSLALTNVTGYSTIALDAVDTGNSTITAIASGTTIAVTDEADGDTIALNTAAAGGELSVTLDDADAYEGGDAFSFGANVSTVNFAIDEDTVDADDLTATFAAAAAVTVNITGDDSTDDDLTGALTFSATVLNVEINSAPDLTISTDGATLDDDITLDFSGSTGAIALTVDEADLALSDTTLVGGSGSSDTLTVDIAATTNAATVSGFETVVVTDANGGTLDLGEMTGVTAVQTDADGIGTGNLTINDADTATIQLSDGAGPVDITLDGSSTTGAGLTLDLTLEDALADQVIVTDIETVNLDLTVASGALDFDLSDAEVDTLVITSDAAEDSVFAATSTFAGVNTLDLSGVAGDLDLDDVTLAAGVNITLGASNDTIKITLAGATRQTITFGTDIANGEDVILTNFDTGIGATGDLLDLSALGITDIAELTFTDADFLAAGGGNVDVVITADAFDGEIVLLGVLTADVAAANLIVG